jgi:uncharacterized protein
MPRVVAGRVVELWRHPVKSMQGESLDAADVGPNGLDCDRRLAVRDGTTGSVLSAKRVPLLLEAAAAATDDGVVVTLPTGDRFLAGDPQLDVALTTWLDRPVSMVAAADVRPSGEPFFDAAPVHLLTTASLRAEAAAHPAGEWATRRFRPNLLVEVPGSDFVEDGWVEQDLTVGGVRLHVRKRTIRCVMTSAPQPGLGADPEILATTGRTNDKRLGVYVDVVVGGRVHVGAELGDG